MIKNRNEWTFGECLDTPEFEKIKPYLIFFGEKGSVSEELREGTLDDCQKIGWSPEGILSGNQFTAEQFRKNASIHFVYPEEECKKDSAKKDVNIIRFVPERIDEKKPYIVLVSGGGYSTVCTMVESIPTAEHFVKKGYQVFSVTYRVNEPAVMQKAQDDIAACFCYIKAHAKEFSLNPDLYAIGGFSAGAQLISSWGTTFLGYKKYGFAKPVTMFPIYTFIDIDCMYKDENYENFMNMMFGGDRKPETLHRYNIVEHIDKDYPPCYIVCGKDDAMIPSKNSEKLKEILDQLGIAAELEEADHAQHGFGDGTETAVEGWPERAIDFMERNINIKDENRSL